MTYLQPDWSQPKLTLDEAKEMCRRIKLTPADVSSSVIDRVLGSLRQAHLNGAAFLAAFGIEEDPIFDRFAAQNRLLQYQVLGRLLYREEVRDSLKALAIPPEVDQSESEADPLDVLTNGFTKESTFLFPGKLAWILHEGGAYHKRTGDGSEPAALARDLCNEMFQHRYAEVVCFTSSQAWTPWFYDVAWDFTAVLIDLRKRQMWVLAITDTD